MGLLSLLFCNPLAFLILALVLLYSVILHEVAHGWMALRFGDETALHYGRLTLNPASHLDPLGTLLLFLVGFGWARPVPVDYYRLKDTRFGLFSVALAGCTANILIAISAIFLLRFEAVSSQPLLSNILPLIARINIILGAFNLIPIPPLDGSKIMMSFLPQGAQEALAILEPYGFFILAFLLFTGLLNPFISLMERMVYNFITFFFHFL
jgi:Zn-dependent protease